MEMKSDMSASSEQAPVDFERSLKGLGDDGKLLEGVAQMLLEQITVDLTAIQSNVAASNSCALADASHHLKGSLGAIAAVPAYLACAALNRSARCGAIASYLPELARLEHELTRLRRCLQVWLIEQEKCGS